MASNAEKNNKGYLLNTIFKHPAKEIKVNCPVMITIKSLPGYPVTNYDDKECNDTNMTWATFIKQLGINLGIPENYKVVSGMNLVSSMRDPISKIANRYARNRFVVHVRENKSTRVYRRRTVKQEKPSAPRPVGSIVFEGNEDGAVSGSNNFSPFSGFGLPSGSGASGSGQSAAPKAPMQQIDVSQLTSDSAFDAGQLEVKRQAIRWLQTVPADMFVKAKGELDSLQNTDEDRFFKWKHYSTTAAVLMEHMLRLKH